MPLSILCTFVGASPVDSGKCFYRFDVWKPDQDVTRRLDSIDGYKRNLTDHFNVVLLRFRNDMIQEIQSIKNTSHLIEKQLLEQKVKNAQLRIHQQELQISFLHMKDSYSEVLSSFASKNTVNVIDRKETGAGGTHDLLTLLQSDNAAIQNTIGDLKAEWLLIKREIQKLRNEDHRLKQALNTLSKRFTRVQTLVDGMQSDTLLIKRQQNDLMTESSALSWRAKKNQKENLEMKQYQTRIRKSNNPVQQQLKNVQTKESHPHRFLPRIEVNESGALSHFDDQHNITRSEIGECVT